MGFHEGRPHQKEAVLAGARLTGELFGRLLSTELRNYSSCCLCLCSLVNKPAIFHSALGGICKCFIHAYTCSSTRHIPSNEEQQISVSRGAHSQGFQQFPAARTSPSRSSPGGASEAPRSSTRHRPESSLFSPNPLPLPPASLRPLPPGEGAPRGRGS